MVIPQPKENAYDLLEAAPFELALFCSDEGSVRFLFRSLWISERRRCLSLVLVMWRSMRSLSESVRNEQRSSCHDNCKAYDD